MAFLSAVPPPARRPLGIGSSPLASPKQRAGVGQGTWAAGNRLIYGYTPDRDAAFIESVHAAVAAGVTFFDTADSYGLTGTSESLLGAALASAPSIASGGGGGVDTTPLVATKLATYPWRLTRGSVVAAARGSARRLGRPPDIAQVHWSPARYAPWQERTLYDGFADAYQAGLIRGVGLSNYGPVALRAAERYLRRQRGVPVVCAQVQWSLLSRSPSTDGFLEVAGELGVTPIGYSPLALGLLTGKYRAATGSGGREEAGRVSLPSSVVRRRLFARILPEVAAAGLDTVMAEVAALRGWTPAQVAIAYVVAAGGVPIPGAWTPGMAVENAAAGAGAGLTRGEVDALEAAAARVPTQMVQNIFSVP
ncbi:hypothetical protein MMPV_003079 [Pyropia vietnamensis]